MRRTRPRPARPTRTALALAVLALITTACGGTGGGADDSRRLTVMAAASLTESFSKLADRFEASHDGVEVVTSFDSSATLATQVASGAPADVVATADLRTMQMMVEADAVAGDPVVFARNVLTLAVPADNPARIERLADLQGSEFVVCAPAVPCGALATQALDEAGVTTRPRSLEVDVKAVLTKVVLGEADAGLVYASDVVAARDRVVAVPAPELADAATDYPVAVTADSGEPDLAGEFVDLLRSEEGRQVLDEAGLEPATGTPEEQQ